MISAPCLGCFPDQNGIKRFQNACRCKSPKPLHVFLDGWICNDLINEDPWPVIEHPEPTTDEKSNEDDEEETDSKESESRDFEFLQDFLRED